MTLERPSVITISRQLGSGGTYLAQRVARQLGYAYADRQILKLAAEKLEVDIKDLTHRDEKVQSYWDRLFQIFSVGTPECLYTPPPLRVVSDEQLLATEQRIIKDLAGRGRCVIVGHGAFHLLKGQAGVLNVFMHAAMDFRVARVMKLYRMSSRDEARRIIERADRKREKYIRIISGCNWFDARNYHLTMDLERIGFEDAERLIESIAIPSGAGAGAPLSDPAALLEDTEP